VVALGRDEHLRLVLQAAERLRVDDAVAVALERRAQPALLLGSLARGRVGRRGERGELRGLLRAHARRERLGDGTARVRGGSHGHALILAPGGAAPPT